MKRLFFTIISVVMFFIDANGAKVKIETARQEAISFFAKKGYNHSSDSVFSVENDVDEFYIFYNAKKDYVIVSGSDKTRHSVLGYGSNFTGINNMSPALKLILNRYKEQIEFAEADSSIPSRNNVSNGLKKYVPQVEHESVTPFIQTKWHQYFFGNDTLTGCVATSMAQVMNYYKFPSETYKEIPGYTDSERSYKSLPATTFNWEIMSKYEGNSDLTAKKEIAKLMKYCGHAVQMDYGTEESGSFHFYVEYALENYFGYDSDVRFISKIGYTDDEFENIIINELKNKRPVIFGGNDKNGGHSFICDGYDNECNAFHFNFGWAGNEDGYYELNAIVGIDFSYNDNQDIIIGIKPESHKKVEANNTELQIIKLKELTNYTFDDKVNINLQIKNCGKNDYKGDVYMNATGFLNASGAVMVDGVVRNQTVPFTIASEDSINLSYLFVWPKNEEVIHLEFTAEDGTILATKELYADNFTSDIAYIYSDIRILGAYDSVDVAGIRQYHLIPGRNKALITIENYDTIPFRKLVTLYQTKGAAYTVDTLDGEKGMLTVYPGQTYRKYIEFDSDTGNDYMGSFKLSGLDGRAHWTVRQYVYYCTNKALDAQHAWVDSVFNSDASDILWIDLTSFTNSQIENIDLSKIGSNCIYYANEPSLSKKSANVVANGSCKQLVIDGGKDFYLKNSIYAKEATFTKSFTNSGKEFSWNLIFLPFVPDSAFLPDGTEILKSGLMKIYRIRGFENNTITYAEDSQLNTGCGFLMGIPTQLEEETTVTFKAHDVTVPASEDIRIVCKNAEFIGSTVGFENLGKTDYFASYSFDPKSFTFIEDEEIMAKVAPFTLNFFIDNFEESFELGNVTSVELTKSDSDALVNVYTPLGRYVGLYNLKDWEPGDANLKIYIVKGQKLIR